MAGIAGLESTINGLLSMDATVPAKLAKIDGKIVHIHLSGPNIDLYFLPQTDRISIQSQCDNKADTFVTGTPGDFVELMLAKDPASALINGDIKVKGETSTLMALQALLHETELDWEYELSKVVGDVAAHNLGKLVNKSINWLQKSHTNIEQKLQTYVYEQGQLLASREQIEAFCHQVDDITARFERFEAKFNQKNKG